ncbi:MAG: polysaccharide pyruvyl transferase family protein [Chloroflexota bacterium]|nr:polysaccharide pyruvyl transferase family protein [Chloroflexota bacterium]
MREPILVVGAYGYRNTGDEAILAGLLTTLAGRRVTVVSRSPAETTALHGVAAVGLHGAVPALRRHRTLLIGGGGLFGRDVGRIGRLLPIFGLLAAALGRQVIVVGVGVDAGMTGTHRLLVRRLLRAADQVTVRDEASARLLREWGIAPLVEEDLSARMAPASARIGRSLLRGAGVDERRPVIGLCLTAVNDSLTPGVMAAAADLMQRHPESQFCFIPMSQHPFVERHNDLLLARSLQAISPGLKIVEGTHHPATLLSLVGALDAVVAMRYHALLFAERAGIPLIPIAYADKSIAWLGERRLRAVEPTGRALSRAVVKSLPARSRAS